MTPEKLSPQCQEILAELRERKRVTTHELQMMGIVAVATRIMELRRQGFNITCQLEPYINKYGRTIQRGIYTLHESKAS